MGKLVKKRATSAEGDSSPPKRTKIDLKNPKTKGDKHIKENPIKTPQKTEKGPQNTNKSPQNIGKSPKSDKPKFSKPEKPKTFQKGAKPGFKKPVFNKSKPFKKPEEKPADWNEFKKKKKEVREKRKQSKSLYEVITKAKAIGEKLRMKKLTGGAEERNKLVAELHTLMGNQGNYVKFVLAHDMARIVQYMLKFGKPNVREEISNELIPSTVLMLQSKYGKFCVKRMLKYGNATIRANCIKALYGNAVKLTSHAISAPVFEFAYSEWATPQDKISMIQEFFGDIYKQTKDMRIKHLKDVYADSPDMKAAALGATKANLLRILNKNLLDSGLIQTVLSQFLSECSKEDKSELITQLAPHVVVLSNSKDGARVVMQCIWHGTNKDRKVAMKALKEHVVELCKHEHGYEAIIALLDAADDTVLVQKMILTEILNNVQELVVSDSGRKVLLWLVNPANQTHFHPHFIKELDAGREGSTCKKEPTVRRKELLHYSSKILLTAIAEDVKFWLEEGSRSVVTLAILKTGSGKKLQETLKIIAETIVDLDWKLKDGENEVPALEHAGLHMTLKKLAVNDKRLQENNETTFAKNLIDLLNENVIKCWVKFNRGCFFLLMLYENNCEEVQRQLKEKLSSSTALIKKQTSKGASILLKKFDL